MGEGRVSETPCYAQNGARAAPNRYGTFVTQSKHIQAALQAIRDIEETKARLEALRAIRNRAVASAVLDDHLTVPSVARATGLSTSRVRDIEKEAALIRAVQQQAAAR